MPRRVASTVLAVLLSAALLAPSAGAAGPPSVPDHIRGFSIVPPGQEGTVTNEEFMTGDYGPHYQDQLDMYASLVEDGDVTEDELSKYFHSMQFGPDGTIERTYEPTDGVTVYRDGKGIPHIYADSMTTASFALGYVSAEDRMFQMDVFRHAARGTLTEFLGSGPDNAYLNMDIATRREGYTDEEITKMYNDLDDKFGATGKLVQDGLTAYSEGINQYIDEISFDPETIPFEYNATGNPQPIFPEYWNPNDTLFLVVLQLRVFGETAGQELDTAGLLFHLQKKHGKKKGLAIFNDLAFQNDSTSYTSVRPEDGAFPSQRLGKVDWSSVAIPDHADTLASSLRRRDLQLQRTLTSFGRK